MHIAVDTLRHLLAVLVTPANEGDRIAVSELTRQVQEITGDAVQLAWVDQGYTGEEPAHAAEQNGIELVVKLKEAKRGFVLLSRRWVVECSFAWATRFRRLAKGYERLPETVAGLHFLVFASPNACSRCSTAEKCTTYFSVGCYLKPRRMEGFT